MAVGKYRESLGSPRHVNKSLDRVAAAIESSRADGPDSRVKIAALRAKMNSSRDRGVQVPLGYLIDRLGMTAQKVTNSVGTVSWPTAEREFISPAMVARTLTEIEKAKGVVPDLDLNGDEDIASSEPHEVGLAESQRTKERPHVELALSAALGRAEMAKK